MTPRAKDEITPPGPQFGNIKLYDLEILPDLNSHRKPGELIYPHHAMH